ncbi:MAG: hypothetical protein WBB85_12300 [Albidovulum sp.]|uniref:hypothetical protein n=1 Tax=Albidovulum sp. TaxID=1872424 RepID=UPI003C7F0E70
MIHMTSISASPKGAIAIQHPKANLGHIVREQLSSMTAAGYSEVDVRWSNDMLLIEAKGDSGNVQRRFNRAGICVMENIDNEGIGIKRCYDENGMALISEEIRDEDGDC